MDELVLQFDFLQGAIKTTVYDASTQNCLTGVKVVDEDSVIWDINAQIDNIYSSLYVFGVDGCPCYFDNARYEEIKNDLSKLVTRLISRLEEINDGSFVIVNKLPLDLYD